MRIYNIFGRLARTHYRNRATASTACTPNATCCSIYLPFPHKYHGRSPLIALCPIPSYGKRIHSSLRSTKRPNIPPSGSTFSPPSRRCSPRLRDFLSKLPNFFRKTGRNLPKVTHFLFHHSRYTFETAKKSRKIPTTS